jgi:Mrp family chromosome partitioning ATPase
MVTRSTNTLFTGRYDILHELENIARDAIKDPSRQKQCRIVISGIGGQGKSEICLQLAHRIRQS